jgi:hypothetical protein
MTKIWGMPEILEEDGRQTRFRVGKLFHKEDAQPFQKMAEDSLLARTTKWSRPNLLQGDRAALFCIFWSLKGSY